jgi:hypothetical protein
MSILNFKIIQKLHFQIHLCILCFKIPNLYSNFLGNHINFDFGFCILAKYSVFYFLEF